MGGGSERSHFPWTDGVIYDNFGSDVRHTTVDPTPALTSWRLYNVSSAPNSWSSSLDTTKIYSTNTNTVYFSSANRYIGRSVEGTGDYILLGYIAEILFYGQVQSAANKSTIEQYLKTKYNLSY